jgi:hypothetical protein
MLKRTLLFFCLQTLLGVVYCQELDLKVKIDVSGNITSDKDIIKGLEKNISELLNSTRWTDDSYENYERIKGDFLLVITEEPSPGVFKGEITLQTERPVYQTIYRSRLINLIDNHVNFIYTGQLPLNKTTTIFIDNLSSIISYYAYVVIGLDKDSFSAYGGEDQFKRAQEIISSLAANVTNDSGWKLDGATKRNRYWLVNNLLHPRMRPFRQAFYEYHRLCLDKMTEDVEKARAIMLSTLTSVGQVEIDYPTTMLIQVFGDTKKDEIIEIFKVADRGSKNKVKTIMVGLDAFKKDKYNALN